MRCFAPSRVDTQGKNPGRGECALGDHLGSQAQRPNQNLIGREMLHTVVTQGVPAPLLGTPPIPPHTVADFLEEAVWCVGIVVLSARRLTLDPVHFAAVSTLRHVDVLPHHFAKQARVRTHGFHHSVVRDHFGCSLHLKPLGWGWVRILYLTSPPLTLRKPAREAG